MTDRATPLSAARDGLREALEAMWEQHEDAADYCGFNRATFEKHRDAALTAASRASAVPQPEVAELRDHEWCLPHEHVETDMGRWERDQAASLARASAGHHDARGCFTCSPVTADEIGYPEFDRASAGALDVEPIYCTGGCDVCRDYARELGVPLIVMPPPAAQYNRSLGENNV